MEDREKTPEELKEEQEKMNAMIKESFNYQCRCGGVIYNVGLLTKVLPKESQFNPTKEREAYFDVPIKYCVRCHAPQDINTVEVAKDV